VFSTTSQEHTLAFHQKAKKAKAPWVAGFSQVLATSVVMRAAAHLDVSATQ
jgi:hypothetical protein